MAVYRFRGLQVNISRVGALLDTNVLVAAFSERDKYHEIARFYLTEWDTQLYVPISVVVETWGVLVSRDKKCQAGLDCLSWIITPGNAMPLPETSQDLDQAYEIVVRKPSIDQVDALLLKLAHDISTSCSLNPPLQIATFDTGDFLRFKDELAFDVFDLRTWERC